MNQKLVSLLLVYNNDLFVKTISNRIRSFFDAIIQWSVYEFWNRI